MQLLDVECYTNQFSIVRWARIARSMCAHLPDCKGRGWKPGIVRLGHQHNEIQQHVPATTPLAT